MFEISTSDNNFYKAQFDEAIELKHSKENMINLLFFSFKIQYINKNILKMTYKYNIYFTENTNYESKYLFM